MARAESPFKFLDAYEKVDIDIFFGRETEVDELYHLVFETKLVLMYGAMGTGKTSIIQCGLANKIDTSQWMELYVRKRENINISLIKAIKNEIYKVKPDAKVSDNPLEALNLLYLYYFKPTYLVFDQFEELFVFGTETEQEQFFQTINAIVDSNLTVKIILVMREEYIAQLSDFEKIIPNLFQYRLRIENMKRQELKNVIIKTTKAFGIELENEEVADQIIDILSNKRTGVELTYLQVYLDKLYREAKGEKVVFRLQPEDQITKLEDVMADFLDEQLQSIDQKLGREKTGIALKILNYAVTDEGTKQAFTVPSIREDLKKEGISPEDIAFCMREFQKLKLIKPLETE